MRDYLLLIAVLLCGFSSATASPSIVNVFPRSHSITAEVNTEIVITFDAPVQPESFKVTSFYVFGRWSGPAQGAFIFEEDNTRVRFVSDRPFMAGEWVTVSLSRSISDSAGAPMAQAYTWNFWTRSLPAGFEFEQIDEISTRSTKEGRIRSYGAYAGDLDRDGYSDLLIPNEDTNDFRVFMNNGAGGYRDYVVYQIPDAALPSTNEGADFDLDGLVDVAVGNSRSNTISVWKGDGTRRFSHLQNAGADEQVRGLCVLDLNGDGYFDMVTANRLANASEGNVSMLLNDGTGRFPVSIDMETGTVGETACAAADANGDGILDVFIGSFDSNELILLLGDGEGGLIVSDKVSAGRGVWMVVAGDVNGDGFADVLSANSTALTMSVAYGDGVGGLEDPLTYGTGSFPIAIDLGDLDGDGDLDIVTSNFSSADYSVFENIGEGVFNLVTTLPASTSGSCAVLHDRDNDGDLDITGIDEIDDLVFLFENRPIITHIDAELQTQIGIETTNFPNPFYERTSIRYHLEKPFNVRITMYNLAGQEIRTLFEGSLVAGTHTVDWDGEGADGNSAPAGVYFYRIESNHASQTGHVLKLR